MVETIKPSPQVFPEQGKTLQYIAVEPINKPPPFHNDPFFSIHWTTYLLLVFLSLFSGFVRYLRSAKYRRKMSKTERLLHLATEMFVAVFSGLLTFWVAMQVGASMTQAVIMVSLGSHFGGKTIDNLGRMYQLWIDSNASNR